MKFAPVLVVVLLVASGRAFAASPKVDEALMASLLDPSIDAPAVLGRISPPGEEERQALLGYLTNPIASYRAMAVAVLGLLGEPQAAGRMAPLLGDESSKVRSAAGEALGRIGSPAIAPVIAWVDGSPVEPDTDATRTMMVRIGEPAVLPLLLGSRTSARRSFLENVVGAFDGVCVAALCRSALAGQAGDIFLSSEEQLFLAERWVFLTARRDATLRMTSLQELAGDNAVPEGVRAWAGQEYEALKRARAKEPKFYGSSLPPEKANRDRPVTYREMAELLKTQDGLSSLRVPKPEEVDLLKEALKDRDPLVRGHAAMGLQLAGDKSAVVPLIQALKRDLPEIGDGENKDIVGSTTLMIWALEHLGGKDAYEYLTRVYADEILERLLETLAKCILHLDKAEGRKFLTEFTTVTDSDKAAVTRKVVAEKVLKMF